MNRIHHLQQTLVKNIEDNISYPEIEFIILDYNSSDGLDQWVKSDLNKYIKSGILKYYRTTEPEYFDRSHSRNLMFKLATGSVICNMDADNYAGKDFAFYINREFNTSENIFLVADTQKRFYFLRNAFGRFCVKKEDFIALGGLDEKMKSYGSETVDFYERLIMSGKRETVIENTHFLKTISHGDEERISNEFFLKSLSRFFIKYISYEESEVLFLYNDYTYESGYIISATLNPHLPAALKEGSLRKGIWKESGSNIELSYDGLTTSFEYDGLTLKLSADIGLQFYQITDQRFLLHVAKNYAFITNVETLHENKKEHKVAVNDLLFGTGSVVKNFEEEIVVS